MPTDASSFSCDHGTDASRTGEPCLIDCIRLSRGFTTFCCNHHSRKKFTAFIWCRKMTSLRRWSGFLMSTEVSLQWAKQVLEVGVLRVSSCWCRSKWDLYWNIRRASDTCWIRSSSAHITPCDHQRWATPCPWSKRILRFYGRLWRSCSGTVDKPVSYW